MIQLESGIDNQLYSFSDLEDILKRLEFTIGGNWDYDHAYFDYKLESDEEKYVFLRIPVSTEIGNLDEAGAQVRIGKPFVLAHRFESGIDHESDIRNISGAFNQFQSPEEKDADVDRIYVKKAEQVLQQVERALLQ
ncbi:YugN family protein [Bacillaceae bacterium W0354]